MAAAEAGQAANRVPATDTIGEDYTAIGIHGTIRGVGEPGQAAGVKDGDLVRVEQMECELAGISDADLAAVGIDGHRHRHGAYAIADTEIRNMLELDDIACRTRSCSKDGQGDQTKQR